MYLISDKSAWNLDSENGGGKVRLGGQASLFFPILLQQYPPPPPLSIMNEVTLSTQLKPVWIQDKNTGHGYALAAPGGVWTLIFAIGQIENLTFLI